MRSLLALILSLLFALATASYCPCPACPSSDQSCKKRGGCFRLDVEFSGHSVFADDGCHDSLDQDRYLQQLLQLPPKNQADEILTIFAAESDSSNKRPSPLVVAFSYCRPLASCSVDRKLGYSTIEDDGNCSWSRWTTLGWKDDGRLVGIHPLRTSICSLSSNCLQSGSLAKKTFANAPTLCEWYAEQGDATTPTVPSPGREYSRKVWYAALGAAIFTVSVLAAGIGIYEFIRWWKHKRRRKSGIGFGDAASIGKSQGSKGTARSHKSSRASSKDSMWLKDQFSLSMHNV